ncbi:MAG TPA: amidohydrolase family protein [Kofleriaceae bacterium]|nr:amidohydrolase family protein [Kofleriaceae bacterium]
MRFVAVVVAVVACSRPLSTNTSTHAHLLLVNGHIFTGDPAQPWTDTIAIGGDEIVAIGDEAKRFTANRRIDLGGRLVIPGINDAHVHEPNLLPFVDVAEGFDKLTVADLLAAFEKAEHEQPAGTWLRGDLSQAALDDPTLTKATLDRVAPTHPVWLDNFAGHVVVMNSAAEKLLGLDHNAPHAGFLGREDSGADDGWRYEYARYEAKRRIGLELSDADIARAMHDFEQQATTFGITTVQTFPLDIEAERLVIAGNVTRHAVRWHVIRFPLGSVIDPPRASPPDASSRLYLSGTKYILDGTPVERGAALLGPYHDRAGWEGRVDWSREEVRHMLVAARASGDALHVHVAGDRSVVLVLDLMQELGGDWRASRVVLEHGDGLAAADFARAQQLGVIVVQNPIHSATAELNHARLGDRALHWMPMRSLLAARIPFALGSDGPLNPFLNIMMAEMHPTNHGEALTREQAVIAYTQGAAFDERLEQRKGKLVPGMVADIAVLSQDIFKLPADALPATRSVLTIVGGEVVYDASRASAPTSARTE